MDNQELKLKFEEVKNQIEKFKQEGKDTAELLKVKYDLLKVGFERIKERTSDESFDKNPKKYSTLLSYLNSMKEIAQEINLPLNEINTFKSNIVEEMKKNNLDWLLNE